MKKLIRLCCVLVLYCPWVGLGQDTVWIREHHPNGQINVQTPTVNGLREGKATSWFPNGNIKLEVRFEKGKRIHEVAYAYVVPGRKMWEKSFNPEDSTSFLVRDWHPNGRFKGEGKIIKGRRHGKETYYTDYGRELTRTYVDGKLMEGSDWLRVVKQTEIATFERIYKDGACSYLIWTEYFQSGPPKKQESYSGGACSRGGTQDGTWIEWYESGQKLSEFQYADGKQTGDWYWWYPNGQTKIKMSYEDGRMVQGSMVQWDEQGNVQP